MAYDAAGSVIARAQTSYTTVRPAPYQEEQDPDWVRQEVFATIRECLRDPQVNAGEIRGIGFSSQMYGVIALDENDQPLTRNILWSDGRAEAQADAIAARLGKNVLYPITGCPMNSIFPIAKIAWLREENYRVFKQTRRFVSIKEYVTQPLIGEWAVDYSMASATGLFDIRAKRWSDQALEVAGIGADKLSTPVSGTHAYRMRKDSPLSNCGLAADVQVFLGGGDGPLANLGSGAARPGTVNIDLGTSGAARCLTDRAMTDHDGSLWCFCLTEQRWAVGGIVTNAGNAYQWLAANVVEAAGPADEPALERLDRLVTATPANADELYFLPYLRKVRSPYWDGRLKGTLFGLTPDHTLGHIARALLEALSYDLRTIVEIMRRNLFLDSQVVLTGGLSKSPVLPQILADVLDTELRVPNDSEGSIAGAAILALNGLGLAPDLVFPGSARNGKTYRPNPKAQDDIRHAYQNYCRLVAALRVINLPERKSS